MIKLIATDLDGTLLNSRKELPEEFPQVFSALSEKGILLVPVSGRSYPRLCELFGSFSKDMSFICSNGCLVMHKDEVVYNAEYSVDELTEILHTLRSIPELHICFCGIHTAYYEDKTPRIEKQMKEFFGSITYVDHVEDIVGRETVVKISNIDDGGVQENSFPRAADLAKKYYIADAGDNWLDVMPQGADKGAGLHYLCSTLNIKPDEVMVFGDFLNDKPMMTFTENSWCMKNGHEEIKKISRHITEWTNEENGVLRTIKKEILHI